jgi:lipopolysaccharide/colanic/teichoic acid biosynthesis glycosyltransferase
LSFPLPATELKPSWWCHSTVKAVLDVTVASIGLLIALPMMLSIALLIAVTSRGPVLFRQWRCGRNGQLFELLKFRTMLHDSDGPRLTRADDCRITSVGRPLRRWKLDELPQLINVISGKMSLVGPRPDLPEIWNLAGEVERKALALKPGLTGAASLAFRDEEDVLAQAPAGKLTDFYLNSVLPKKTKLDIEYAAIANPWNDFMILLQTVCPKVASKPPVIQPVPLDEQISR